MNKQVNIPDCPHFVENKCNIDDTMCKNCLYLCVSTGYCKKSEKCILIKEKETLLTKENVNKYFDLKSKVEQRIDYLIGEIFKINKKYRNLDYASFDEIYFEDQEITILIYNGVSTIDVSFPIECLYEIDWKKIYTSWLEKEKEDLKHLQDKDRK
jgi:hypothetical protein